MKNKKIVKEYFQREYSKKENLEAILSDIGKDNNMGKRRIMQMAATFLLSIGITAGVAFAGKAVYDNIWKEPERVQLTSNLMEEEKVAQENISEEEAKKIAEEKLISLGFGEEEITGTNHYTDQVTGEMNYRFLTKNWGITIEGFSGEFFDLVSDKMYDKSIEKYEITQKEAIEIANEYYKSFGYKEGEYELKSITAQNKDYLNSNEKGFKWDVNYYKKYGNLYNSGESVYISFYAKDKQLNWYRFTNKKCDNNPVEITKEKAIEIAKTEDRKVESAEVLETDVELKIRSINDKAYARLNNTEEFYKPMTTTDVPIEETVHYKTEDRVRIVWVVVLKYGEGKVENKGNNLTQEQETENLMNRYVKGQFAYYVDATTGEIIGGDTEDELHWERIHSEESAVKQ